jgi:outer membrane murein-binding lipoprotein Lpp
MLHLNNRLAGLPAAAVLVLGGLGLSGCATTEYVDEQIATVNTHLSAVESKADAAGAAAQSAQSTAQAAQADAARANNRLDELTGRMGALEQHPALKTPRN